MAIVKAKPTSPGRRGVVSVVHKDLYKGRPHAALLEKKSKSGGRNNNGRITTRHIGGGHKQHYRVIDFKRNKDGIPAKIERVEYDPNRSAHIALPVGTIVHCIELKPGKGAQVARSAGASVQIVAREGQYVTLRLRSGEMRKVLSECRATVGVVSNGERTSGGRHPVTPWGVPTKGYKTRSNKRTDRLIVRRRNKK